MVDFDSETLAERVSLLGLATREQVRLAQADAADGSLNALKSSFVRKQILTSWQADRLIKGDVNGFFYGGCKVLFHLAEGTFARVYRGVRVADNQSVAVKVLRNRFVSDPNAIDSFYKEAEAGQKLVHPNIVRVYEYGEQDGRYYMVMEYVEGSNLRDFLKFRHRLDAAEAMPLILGLARGLQYSLGQGITHRDIKGTNILIASRGEAKLVDFGLATIDSEKKAAVAHGQRTVDYSALERTCGSPKGDPRSDIFFMGCVLYQMLTGILPLPEVEATDMLAKMLKRSFGAIRPIRELRHAPPEDLCVIIDKMMMIDLTKRYQNMDAVVADLEAYDVAWRAGHAPSAPAQGPEALSRKTSAAPPANAAPIAPPAPAPAPAQVAPVAPAAAAPAAESYPDDDYELPAADDDETGFVVDFEVKALRPRTILCVESQHDIQDALRKSLSRLGYRVLLVGDAERAAERYRELAPDAVLYDLDGLGPRGLDGYLDMHEKAHEDGHNLAAVVLLGPRQGELARKLPPADRVTVLSKPVKMKQVQDAVTRLVPAKAV